MLKGEAINGFKKINCLIKKIYCLFVKMWDKAWLFLFFFIFYFMADKAWLLIGSDKGNDVGFPLDKKGLLL